nr:hypothetical protein [Megavirus caiporensis]
MHISVLLIQKIEKYNHCYIYLLNIIILIQNINNNPIMNSTKENLDRLFESLEEMSGQLCDVQEKCNMWNQITASGRKECTQSKKEFYSSFIRWVSDSIVVNDPNHK